MGFSFACCKSGQSIPASSVMPVEVVAYMPDGRLLRGTYDGYGNIETPQGIVPWIEAIHQSLPSDLQLNLIQATATDPKPIRQDMKITVLCKSHQADIEFQGIYKNVLNKTAQSVEKDLLNPAFGLRAFYDESGNEVRLPGPVKRVLDVTPIDSIDTQSEVTFEVGVSCETLGQSWTESHTYVYEKNVPSDLGQAFGEKKRWIHSAIQNQMAEQLFKVVKEEFFDESDTFDDLQPAMRCPHQGYFYSDPSEWKKPLSGWVAPETSCAPKG